MPGLKVEKRKRKKNVGKGKSSTTGTLELNSAADYYSLDFGGGNRQTENTHKSVNKVDVSSVGKKASIVVRLLITTDRHTQTH